MTKAKMTRKEAVECFKKHIPDTIAKVENLIDFYIEAGMLEIVEEKTVEEKVTYSMQLVGYTLTANFFKNLDHYGFKIVEK